MKSTKVEPVKTSSKHSPWARLSLSIALFSLFAIAPLHLQADGTDWEKHTKSAEAAFAKASTKKYRFAWSSYFPRTTPESKGQFAKAEEEYRAALAEARTFPTGDMRLPDTLMGLAWVVSEEGKLADAVDLVGQAISAVQTSHGPDDAAANAWLSQAFANLGLFENFDSKCDQAELAWNRSQAILLKSNQGYPNWLTKMSDQFHRLELPACTLQMDRYVLAVEESKNVPQTRLRQTLVDLARGQRGPDAEQTGLRILELDKQLYGPDDLNTLQDEGQLADVYASEGRYTAELPILLHLQQQRQNTTQSEKAALGKEIDQYALLRLNKAKLVNSFSNSDSRFFNRKLARADAETGRYPEAEALFKQLISEYETGPSPNVVMKQLDLAEDWMSLAELYGKEHRFKEAQDSIDQATKNQEIMDASKFVKNHNDYDGESIWDWKIQNLRAELNREQGEFAAAEPLFRKSIQMAEDASNLKGTLLPGDKMLHFPDFVRLLDDYATLLRDEGKYEDSEALYKRAVFGWAASQHPDAAHTLTGYATLLRKLNRATEAEPLEAKAAEIQATANGPSPLDLSPSTNNAAKN